MTRRARLIASSLGALLLAAVLVSWGGLRWEGFEASLRSIGVAAWAWSLVIQGALYVLRALRLRALLPGDPAPSMGSLTALSASHTMLAYFLPARLGEGALPVLLRRYEGRSASQGIAALLLVRLLDLACLAFTMSATCLALHLGGAYPELPWLGPVGAALLIPGILCAAILAMGAGAVRRLQGATHSLLTSWPSVRSWFDRQLPKLAQDLEATSRKRLLIAGAWTLPLWFGVFGFWGLLTVASGLDVLSWAEATFGASLVVLSTLLPLNLFGGIGFQDAGFTLGFVLLGVEAELASSSAVATHLVYAVNLALFGGMGQLLLGLRGSRS